MKKDNLVYVEDILQAINRIEEYLQDVEKSRFESSTLLQDALIRNFAVIGEAMRRMDLEFLEKHPALPDRDAVTMRNFLIHQYDEIDTDMLWNTIAKDIPELKKIVENILETS